jgi:16S rRNA C967 or C1407 C5-methylase (RsmB/RsmF family)
VTFRLNSGENNFEKVSEILRDPGFVKRYTEGQPIVVPDEHNSLKTSAVDYDSLRMDCKDYYPNQTLFEMMIPRELLKKNLGLKKIHQLVMHSADSGLITRQEIVSMIPPLLLDVKSHHSVFDMCAAPGSKTAQILELMMADHLTHSSNKTRPSGFVVANDADSKRAFMLTHQMNRLNSGNIIIVNHLA